MSATGVLRVEATDGVATLTLNRPERRNALNGALVEALTGALAELARREDVRVVLLRGEGPDFCSGADLAELERIAGLDVEANLADASRLGDLFLAMRAHPHPIVAAVHGRALAGGCGLATACDVILAREDAEFGYPEVHLGFVPAMVMALLRRKVTEGRAFELVTTGSRIDARRAAEIGLVNRVLPGDGFDEAVAAWVADLASRPASAVTLSKRLLYGLDGASLEEGVRRGAEVNVLARMTEACRQGVRRFLDRSK
ncbi:MAG: enoyl-CoA hydratase/isomerase family protein [Gemmatimonadetes bacterium]|nr:MAG: enoyl-CoA hydratase/isomerase family protein [Gemmatimonadota bacterium]